MHTILAKFMRKERPTCIIILLALANGCCGQVQEGKCEQNPSDHDKLTIEQFSAVAVPFSKLPGHHTSTDLLISLSEAKPEDNVLDVACGPGLVAIAFSPHVAHVDGIDITPAMVDQARKAQAERGIENMHFAVGHADPLPYPDDNFSLVITRYSFHHFQAPRSVLREMIRVCKPGGRILVADVTLPADKVQLYDQMETLRDPSHVHALTRHEFATLLSDAGLTDIRFGEYKADFDLDQILSSSRPEEGSVDRLRQMFVDDVGQDHLGVQVHYDDNGRLQYSYPIGVTVGRKPAPPQQL